MSSAHSIAVSTPPAYRPDTAGVELLEQGTEELPIVDDMDLALHGLVVAEEMTLAQAESTAVETASIDTIASQAPAAPVETSLAQSVAILLTMSIAQRVVGLARGVLVCIWLTPALLGTWDLAVRFFFLAAPLIVLGIPGTFGRYLEHYRQRGALRTVIARTTLVCGVLSGLGWLGLVSAPELFAEQVFGSAAQRDLLILSATCLLAVIAFNFLSEALIALRLIRANAILQFLTSIGFAALSVALLAGWRTDASALIVAYAGSCVLLIAGAVWSLRGYWRALPPDQLRLSWWEMWAKLLPFAGWVWLTNLLTNSYESAGRYMIVHFSGQADYDALIGNYHAAQLVPALVLTLAAMIGGTLLPYLTRDWESGRRAQVSQTMNLSLKLITLFNIAVAAGVLLIGPWMFGSVLQGKYTAGEQILHLALANSIWAAAVSVSQMYLWCAEKARWGCFALAIGLAVNVLFNWLWLPQFGLAGGMLATAVASLATLAVTYRLCQWQGMHLELRTCIISLFPAVLLLGFWSTLFALTAVGCLFYFRPGWLLTTSELETVQRCAAPPVRRFAR